MCETVLYYEYAGAGSDTDSYRPNGIEITLVRWPASHYRASEHYTISTRVVINHQLEVDLLEVFNSGWNSDAKAIRKAISSFDKLLEIYPEAKIDEEA